MEAVDTVTFDATNPYPWYRHMRDTQPVYFDEQMRMWYLFRHADVQTAAQDYKTFTAEGSKFGYLGSSFISMDPPRHRKYRTLVSQAFTPRSIAQLEPRITAVVNELIDRFISKGKFDLVSDFAIPLPAIVVSEMFGVPTADYEHFKDMTDRIMSEIERAMMLTEFPAQDELAAYLLPLIEERRQNPGDDVISALLQAEVEGEKLNTYDIQATCVTVLVAGYETTTMLLGNGLFSLTENPEVLDDLRANLDLMPNAVEEVLRYRPPIAGIPRITTTEAQFGDVTIPPGNMVNLVLASANRDERVFSDPDKLDIRRPQSQQQNVAFGYSIHYCLGAPLARLEGKIALTALLTRLPNLRRDPEHPIQIALGPAGFFQGTRSFPMLFDPQA